VIILALGPSLGIFWTIGFFEFLQSERQSI